MPLVCNAATPEALRVRIVSEIELRAWQERAVKTIGRKSKAARDAHERTAVALDNLARNLKEMELRSGYPSDLMETPERQYTYKIVHTGTGVNVEHFYTESDAEAWLANYRVSQEYKAANYRIVPLW